MKWSERRLDELGTLSRGRSRHRPRDAPHLYGGPYPFVQTGNIRCADLHLTEYSQTYSEAGLDQSRLWPAGTLCITIAANIAETAILGIDACFPDSVIGFIADEKQCDARFIKYRFDTIKRRYQQVSQGAAQDNLSQEKLLSFTLTVPPVEVQRRIADVLSAYDDLIENNRRRMALLEEAARQLYEEWFVRLRFPGREHTRFTNGIPEGWISKPLGDVAEFRLGKMLDQKKNKGDLMPYLANVNVRWGEVDLSNLREMRFEDNELDAFGLKCGDIVMCEGGEPGRCAIWKNQLPGMMIQKALHRIRARQNVNHVYLYHSLRHKAQSGQFAMFFTGATIKHLPREKLAKVEVEIPPARLMTLFLEQASPIEDQISLLQTANRCARQARDLLLPRLMSGQIQV
jgi:type I restriction enzyme, S subunit